MTFSGKVAVGLQRYWLPGQQQPQTTVEYQVHVQLSRDQEAAPTEASDNERSREMIIDHASAQVASATQPVSRVRGNVTLSGVRVTVRPMKIGYGRVSTRDQNPAAQHDALTAAGCDQAYVDKAGILGTGHSRGS